MLLEAGFGGSFQSFGSPPLKSRGAKTTPEQKCLLTTPSFLSMAASIHITARSLPTDYNAIIYIM
jgi:hypothetical protein